MEFHLADWENWIILIKIFPVHSSYWFLSIMHYITWKQPSDKLIQIDNEYQFSPCSLGTSHCHIWLLRGFIWNEISERSLLVWVYLCSSWLRFIRERGAFLLNLEVFQSQYCMHVLILSQSTLWRAVSFIKVATAFRRILKLLGTYNMSKACVPICPFFSLTILLVY